VATTAACWYVGIVATNTDYTFTVTNVFLHGIPYLGLVYLYARAPRPGSPRGLGHRILSRGPIAFIATLWVLAYLEELIWDRAIWQERPWLFPFDAVPADSWRLLLVPLLAVPQATHYILDGLIWRRRGNPHLASALRLQPVVVGTRRSGR
jgi:hypothetical protein